MASIALAFILSLVLGFALFAILRYGLPAIVSWYSALIDRKAEELGAAFTELFLLDASPRLTAHLLSIRVPVLAAVVYILTFNFPLTIIAGIAAWFAPPHVLAYIRRRRLERFDDQLVDALSLLSSAVRAGLGLVQAMQSSLEKLEPPASQEFGLILKEFAYGTPLERALENAQRRLGLPNFNIVATALVVNRDKGGDLIEVLDNIGTSLREISRLEKKIQTETASVRFSAKLMTLMPAVIGIIFYFIDPASMNLLFTDLTGSIILTIVIILNVVAAVIIQRIVNVEI